MKYFVSLIFTIGMVIGFDACHSGDVDPKLPPITMTGQDTFGCLINGKVWLPTGKYNVPPVGADFTSTTILDFNSNQQNSGFAFVVFAPILINHIYDLRDTSKVQVVYGLNYNTSPCIYYGYQVSKGSLTISKFDVKNSVLSGVFDFNVYNKDCSPDTVKITEGRFDISDITF